MEKKKKELGKGNPYQKVQGGSWYIFWYVTDTLTGKRKQCRKGGFRTKREAQTYLDKIKGEVATGIFRDGDNLTFKQYSSEWLNNKKNLSPTTIEHYSFLLDKHIIPLLGAKKLKDLSPRVIEQFYNYKENEGIISNTTIKHLHRLIVNILNSAVRKDYMLSNPATKVDNIPQKNEFNPELIELEDIQRVINSKLIPID
ncbi:Arm DNA-binding domain-containing protein [Clostridium sp. D46t1_190503_E9]|uniref:Arm DNA-binding domain-containing protein n=1 Tax=Clostridium sp. D46t1_190503_E9 TaxID=2787137 RepID=UPI00189B597F|nr:Arm DNA-binding domain-containing protein [Clostridium sp. D46t1_190503_E9]